MRRVPRYVLDGRSSRQACAASQANGRMLSADESDERDLLWAVRGGGGGFGVVTCARYRLHPLGPVRRG